MHADILVAGAGARFGQPEVLVGIMPGGGATQRLTHAVGKFRAMQLRLLTGSPISAAEALTMGLVSEVVPDAEVEARVLALAGQLAQGPQQAIRFIKEAVLQSMHLPLDQGLQFERKSFQLLFDTTDKTEGMCAQGWRVPGPVRAGLTGPNPVAGSFSQARAGNATPGH